MLKRNEMTSTNALKNGRKLFLMLFCLFCLSSYSFLQAQRCTFTANLMMSSIIVPAAGHNDGSFAIQNVDGTAPFKVTIYTDDANMTLVRPETIYYTNTFAITGLPAGRYWVDIIDAKGCESKLDPDLITPPCTFTSRATAYVVPKPGQSNGSITIDIVDATGPFKYTVYDMHMNVIRPETTVDTEPFTITGLPNAYYWIGITGNYTNTPADDICYSFVDLDLQCYQNCTPTKICTYTQGYYGNPGGKDETHTKTIISSLSTYANNLVIGNETRKITITNAASVLAFMPGGGPSVILKEGNPTLGTTAFNTLYYSGKSKNVLLSQTITLALNLGIPGTILGSVPLSGLVSPEIVNALSDKNVAGLYVLANYALGGAALPAGVTLSEISDAVTAINEYFDECRTFTFPVQAPMPMVKARGAQPKEVTSEVTSDISVAASPNPFQRNIRFVINSKVSGNAELGLYNMAGAKVAVPFSGRVSAGQAQTVDYAVPSTLRGGLMYMLKVGNKTTSGKLVSGSR